MLRQNLTKLIARTVGEAPLAESDDFMVEGALQTMLQEKITRDELLTPPPIPAGSIDENALSDLFTDAPLAQTTASGSLRFLQPRTVLATFLGVCLVGSMAYCGLCYWWMSTGQGGQAQESMALLGMDDTHEADAPGNDTLKHIQTLQRQSGEAGGIVNPEAELNQSSESDLLAEGKPVAVDLEDEKFALLSTEPEKEPVGRPDPFAPLVQEEGGIVPVSFTDSGEKDVLQSVQFTGFIGDVNSKDKVAIIRLADPAGGDRTLVKKAGETFDIEGETVRIQGIAKEVLTVKLRGGTRRLVMNPYVETAPAATNSGITAAGGTASITAGALAGAAAPGAAASAGTVTPVTAGTALEE